MLEQFKPLLAKEADFDLLDFENRKYLASPKLDGIRCTVFEGKVYSRTKKLIPNKYVQHLFGHEDYNHMDGELIVGPDNAPDVYRRTNSGVMSIDGEPEVTFHTFDDVSFHNKPFEDRLEHLKVRSLGLRGVRVVPHFSVANLTHLEGIEKDFLAEGYEGLMLRDSSMPYKFGRSTAKQQHLLKVKRFEGDDILDSEAIILGYDPLMKNQNEATIDALGYSVRSSHKRNKVPQELVGRLHVQLISTGVEFYVGTGLTMQDRKEMWDDRENLVGKIIKVKYFAHGMKDGVPRHPVFLGFRSPLDMSN